MKVAYDLHIHSSLSPCADNEMTPNNIVNMSIIKGLEVIAITDHNSCANVEAVIKCAQKTKLLIIPGMEIETAEEIHVICLFRDIEAAMEMQHLVYSSLPKLKNPEDIFGEQLIMDENDKVIQKEQRLLLTATSISINDVFDIVCNKLKGYAIPAHIDRQANSLISSFGTIPQDIFIPCVEIRSRERVEELCSINPELCKIKRVYSSDAHHLGDINERINFFNIESIDSAENISIDAVFSTLRYEN